MTKWTVKRPPDVVGASGYWADVKCPYHVGIILSESDSRIAEHVHDDISQEVFANQMTRGLGVRTVAAITGWVLPIDRAVEHIRIEIRITAQKSQRIFTGESACVRIVVSGTIII